MTSDELRMWAIEQAIKTTNADYAARDVGSIVARAERFVKYVNDGAH